MYIQSPVAVTNSFLLLVQTCKETGTWPRICYNGNKQYFFGISVNFRSTKICIRRHGDMASAEQPPVRPTWKSYPSTRSSETNWTCLTGSADCSCCSSESWTSSSTLLARVALKHRNKQLHTRVYSVLITPKRIR